MANRYINPNLASKYQNLAKMQKLETPWGFDMPYSQTDDMFNIGSAIGTLWGANYNQRGLDKKIEEGKKILEGYTPQSEPAPQDLNQKYQQATMNEDGTFSMKDAPQKSPFVGQEGMELKGMPNQPNVSDQIKQGKVGYVFGTNGKYAETDNPGTDTTRANQLANQGSARIREIPSKVWNKDQVVADLKAELQKSGGNDWQNQKALEKLMPEIEKRDLENKEIIKKDAAKRFTIAKNNNDLEGMYAAVIDYRKQDKEGAEKYTIPLQIAQKQYMDKLTLDKVKNSGAFNDEELKQIDALGLDGFLKLRDQNLRERIANTKANGNSNGVFGNTILAEDGTRYIVGNPKDFDTFMKLASDIGNKEENKGRPKTQWSQEDQDKVSYYEHAAWCSKTGSPYLPQNTYMDKLSSARQDAQAEYNKGDWHWYENQVEGLRKQGKSWDEIGEYFTNLDDSYGMKQSAINWATDNAKQEKAKNNKVEEKRVEETPNAKGHTGLAKNWEENYQDLSWAEIARKMDKK